MTRYFTGLPCKHGHVCERYVSIGNCLECLSANNRRMYAERGDEFRAKSLARMKALYKLDPDRFRERSRRSYAENKQEWKARVRAYKAAHPEWERARLHLRKEKRKLAPGKFTATDIRAQFAAQSGRCLCGADLTVAWHIDHIVPISRGGTNWPHNIQLLCPPCNLDKGAKTMTEWKGAG